MGSIKTFHLKWQFTDLATILLRVSVHVAHLDAVVDVFKVVVVAAAAAVEKHAAGARLIVEVVPRLLGVARTSDLSLLLAWTGKFQNLGKYGSVKSKPRHKNLHLDNSVTRCWT